MRVGIVGCGFVGSATALLAQHNEHQIKAYDINQDTAKGLSERFGAEISKSLADLSNCEIIFICVPTEPSETGSCDLQIFEEVLIGLRDHIKNSGTVIAQRSTCPPRTASSYSDMFDGRYVVFPSFLSKATWENDSLFPERLLIGGTGQYTKILTDFLKIDGSDPRVFESSFECIELLKYCDNVIDSTLISVWNEILEYSIKIGMDGGDFIQLLQEFRNRPRFKTAWRVPGGAFGKHCFPKDVLALSHEFSSVGSNSKVLEAVHTSNLASFDLFGENTLATADLIRNEPQGITLTRKATKSMKEKIDELKEKF